MTKRVTPVEKPTIPDFVEANFSHVHPMFPLASIAIKRTFGQFWAHNHYIDQAKVEEQQSQYLSRVNLTLNFFFPNDQLAPATYIASTLTPIADQTDHFAAREALSQYLEGPNLTPDELDNQDHIIELLKDRTTLNQFWRDSIRRVYDNDQRLSGALREYDSVAIPTDIWQAKPVAIPLAQIRELASNIQMETIAIAAAQTLDKLRTGGNSADMLRQVFQAESLLAPILEIIAENKDATNNNKRLIDFAMALNSAAKRVRLENAGESQFIDLAKQYLKVHGGHEAVTKTVDNAIKTFTGAELEKDGLATEYDEENHIVSFSGYVTMNGEHLYVFGRRKSLGSLADKIRGYYRDLEGQLNRQEITESEFSEKTRPENMEPMDFVALTFIPLNDNAHKHTLFAKMAQRARDDERVTFKPSVSRRQSLHVRGTLRHRNAAIKALKRSGFSNSDGQDDVIGQQADARGMNLAKMTLSYNNPDDDLPALPIEIQVLDREARRQMTIGLASHFSYKLCGKSPTDSSKTTPAAIREIRRQALENIDHLSALNKRGDRMSRPGIHNRDAKGTVLWLQKIGAMLLADQMLEQLHQ